MDFDKLWKHIIENSDYPDWKMDMDGDLYETFPWIVNIEEQFPNIPGFDIMYDSNEDVIAASFYICPATRNNFAVIAITDSVFPDVKYGLAVGNEEKTNPMKGESGEVVIVYNDDRTYFVAELSLTNASQIPINKMDHILKQFFTKARTLQFKINRK